MDRRSERSEAPPRTEAIADARMSLALWLRAGRVQRGMSVDDVAKVTKIQARILERLEGGKPEGLPADVFVRGFVRSFARCVGLEEAEALRRYAACALGASTSGTAGTSDIAPTARALVEAMAELVPDSAATAARATPRKMLAVDVGDLAAGSLGDLPAGDAFAADPAVEAIGAASAMKRAEPQAGARAARGSEAPFAEAAAVASPVAAGPAPVQQVERAAASAAAVEPVAAIEIAGESSSKRKRSRRARARDRRAARMATGTDLSQVVPPSASGDTVAVAAADGADGAIPSAAPDTGAAEPAIPGAPASLIGEPIATATWSPTMPPAAAAPSVPWRKPAYTAAASATAAAPSLVIDDADPDSAERVIEERAEKHAVRRSFLPPILLDREDRSARQGGLTLAVIILLIAATLTLSYLMRRPGASGDGMTRLETPASLAG